MTRTALVFALLLYSPAPLSALPQSSSATHDQETIREVVDLERQSKEAAIRRDVSFVERTLAEDYVGIGPLGAVVTKADTVAARKAAQLHYDSIEISEMVVRLYGNTAVVTARAEV